MLPKPSLKWCYSPSASGNERAPKRSFNGQRVTSKQNDVFCTTASVRFLIVSDTHDRHDDILKSPPQCDVLLHYGDFTEDDSPQNIEKALDAFSKVEAELRLIIAGNHEISLDKKFYLSQDGTEVDHQKSLSLLSNPQIEFLNEGTHEFSLKSGARFKIYVSPYTPKYGSSAFQYPSNEDRFNRGGGDYTIMSYECW